MFIAKTFVSAFKSVPFIGNSPIEVGDVPPYGISKFGSVTS